ncbi:MFS transporter [Nocardioides pantholopis]|uniref:MFS transporter n=1 Tax=Nocardioides pantholopis TaxID=2483798 RepID=UPI000FD748E0|nr:MFS transporter [Nocardioides pantholopis]
MRLRLLLATLALLTTVTAVVSSLGAPLVPALATELGVPLEDAQWSLTATLLAGVVSTPLVGRLGTGRLRRPVVVGGLVLVTLGTVLAAVAPGLGLLVAGRALQGLGLSLVPLALAVARDVVPAHRLPGVVATLSVTTVAGAGLGYPLTSAVAGAGGIAAAFWLGTGLTAATLLLVLAVLPRDTGAPPAPVDWLGAALSGLGLLGVLLAVSRGEIWGWAAPTTLGSAGLGLLLMAAFVRRTLAVRHPLVDLRLGIRPGVAAPNLVAFVAGVGMYSMLTLVVVVVQTGDGGADWGLGRSVAVAGWVLVPYAVLSVLGNQAARAVARRFGTAALLPTGCLLFLAATLLLAVRHDSLAEVLVAMGVGGLGSGFTFSSLAALMVPHLPPHETGSALALNQVLRSLGFTVGSAASVTLMHLFGGVGETGFRSALLVVAGVWVLAALASWWLGRRTPGALAVG